MGNIADIQQSIKNQFISLFDSVLFIAEHGKGTNEQAFKLLKAKLLDKQIHLFLIDEFTLVEIKLFQDDYEAVEYDGQYITVNFICSELEKSVANNAPTSEIKSYGFGLKRFYETVQNDLKITIPPFISSKALSPDCYHDSENPLTAVVKELQAENALLKKSDTSADIINASESYITFNEAIAYLTKSLDLSIINPCNLLERSIKQGLIIPYFEYFGFASFYNNEPNRFIKNIQISEVHGYFKDYNYLNPNNTFTDLSKDEYKIFDGITEKVFFSDCVKFYGLLDYEGNYTVEPYEATPLKEQMTVIFHAKRPRINEKLVIVEAIDETPAIVNQKAIYFKQSDIKGLINQNPQLKIIPTDQTAQLQAEIDRLTAENRQQVETIRQLNKRLEAGMPAEPIGDKELPPRTANNASKIISALASELLKMDLTQPYADDTNGKIKKAIERQGNQLGNDNIAYWLKLAHEQSI